LNLNNIRKLRQKPISLNRLELTPGSPGSGVIVLTSTDPAASIIMMDMIIMMTRGAYSANMSPEFMSSQHLRGNFKRILAPGENFGEFLTNFGEFLNEFWRLGKILGLCTENFAPGFGSVRA
jgi:hypothetical protein